MNKRKETFLDGYRRSELMEKLHGYYAIKDIDENKTQAKVFHALFISDERLSYDDIAAKFFVDESTVRRYVKMFNKLAIKLKDVK